MKQNFLGKSKLVFSMTICMLFLVIAFCSAGVKADTDWDFTTKPPHMYAIPTGNIGIGTTSPFAKFHVKGTVLFSGTTGGVPLSGAGTRFMWIPSKSALRAGYVSGTQWDNVSIGRYSLAMGYSTKASGRASTAMGDNTIAGGQASTAMGDSTTASNYYSTAMGFHTTASGEASTAIGYITTASGWCSTAMGYNTTASGGYSTAMGDRTAASGLYSTAMGKTITVNGYSSLGIGLNYNDPNWVVNANHVMSIMGGKVGIGTTSPAYTLDVQGYVQAYGYYTGDIFFQKNGKQLWRMYEDENGLYLECLLTGKHYKVVLEETDSTEPDLYETIENLQVENQLLKQRLDAIEQSLGIQ